eukprot:SAG25_NODE_91_length_16078_cov_7.663058_1_plen_104_part_00
MGLCSKILHWSHTLSGDTVLYFLRFEYSWGQLMGYGFFFCSLPAASSLLQLGPVQNLGRGRTERSSCSFFRAHENIGNYSQFVWYSRNFLRTANLYVGTEITA